MSFALAPDPGAIERIFGSAELGKAEILRHWEAARRHGQDPRINVEGMRTRPFPYPHSMPGLRACQAAEMQQGAEGHWRYFDLVQKAHLEENRNIADRGVLLDLAAAIGLDVARFAADMDSEETLRRVLADCREAARRGIVAVPTVEIGGRLIQGAVPASAYRAAVERTLDEASRRR